MRCLWGRGGEGGRGWKREAGTKISGKVTNIRTIEREGMTTCRHDEQCFCLSKRGPCHGSPSGNSSHTRYSM